MGKLRRILVVAVVGAAMLAGTAPASHADCVSAEVFVRDSSGNKDYVVGPKECVVWVPLLPEGGSFGSNHHLLPVGFEIWYVLPPV